MDLVRFGTNSSHECLTDRYHTISTALSVSTLVLTLTSSLLFIAIIRRRRSVPSLEPCLLSIAIADVFLCLFTLPVSIVFSTRSSTDPVQDSSIICIMCAFSLLGLHNAKTWTYFAASIDGYFMVSSGRYRKYFEQEIKSSICVLLWFSAGVFQIVLISIDIGRHTYNCQLGLCVFQLTDRNMFIGVNFINASIVGVSFILSIVAVRKGRIKARKVGPSPRGQQDSSRVVDGNHDANKVTDVSYAIDLVMDNDHDETNVTDKTDSIDMVIDNSCGYMYDGNYKNVVTDKTDSKVMGNSVNGEHINSNKDIDTLLPMLQNVSIHPSTDVSQDDANTNTDTMALTEYEPQREDDVMAYENRSAIYDASRSVTLHASSKTSIPDQDGLTESQITDDHLHDPRLYVKQLDHLDRARHSGCCEDIIQVSRSPDEVGDRRFSVKQIDHLDRTRHYCKDIMSERAAESGGRRSSVKQSDNLDRAKHPGCCEDIMQIYERGNDAGRCCFPVKQLDHLNWTKHSGCCEDIIQISERANDAGHSCFPMKQLDHLNWTKHSECCKDTMQISESVDQAGDCCFPVKQLENLDGAKHPGYCEDIIQISERANDCRRSVKQLENLDGAIHSGCFENSIQVSEKACGAGTVRQSLSDERKDKVYVNSPVKSKNIHVRNTRAEASNVIELSVIANELQNIDYKYRNDEISEFKHKGTSIRDKQTASIEITDVRKRNVENNHHVNKPIIEIPDIRKQNIERTRTVDKSLLRCYSHVFAHTVSLSMFILSWGPFHTVTILQCVFDILVPPEVKLALLWLGLCNGMVNVVVYPCFSTVLNRNYGLLWKQFCRQS